MTGVALNQPADCTFDITDRCQSRCLTCTKWKTPQELVRRELATQEWKNVISVMKEWLGEFHFILAGGEPFLRKDIFDICSFANHNGVRFSIISNGLGFSHLAPLIVRSGVEALLVSLNGSRSETHDATRGIRGAYYKTMEFITEVNRLRKPLGAKAPKILLNTILMPFNSEEIIELVKWVRSEGLDGINLQPLDPFGSFHPYSIPDAGFVAPRNTNGEWYRKNFEEKARLRIALVVDQLTELKEKGFPIKNSVETLVRLGKYYTNPADSRRICPIGVTWFNIDPYGSVRFCFDMPSIGNILETSPDKLYCSKEAVAIRQRIRNCKRTCHWAIC